MDRHGIEGTSLIVTGSGPEIYDFLKGPLTIGLVPRDVGVNFDRANLILYGKANPVDALDLPAPPVMVVHAKDGKGKVDFPRIFSA